MKISICILLQKETMLFFIFDLIWNSREENYRSFPKNSRDEMKLMSMRYFSSFASCQIGSFWLSQVFGFVSNWIWNEMIFMSIGHHSCWDIFLLMNLFLLSTLSRLASNPINFFDKIIDSTTTLWWSQRNTFYRAIKND